MWIKPINCSNLSFAEFLILKWNRHRILRFLKRSANLADFYLFFFRATYGFYISKIKKPIFRWFAARCDPLEHGTLLNLRMSRAESDLFIKNNDSLLSMNRCTIQPNIIPFAGSVWHQWAQMSNSQVTSLFTVKEHVPLDISFWCERV